jgi:type IV pilus assembly protein PilV
MKTQFLHFRQISRKGRKARGVALIEALMAILIFSLGVLGLVGLQASMTRAQSAGKFRSDASSLASEAIGLMWVDKGNMAKYASATCDAYQPCLDWKNKVASVLPGGAAVVTANATDGAVSVTLTWTVPNEGTHTYATSTAVLVN